MLDPIRVRRAPADATVEQDLLDAIARRARDAETAASKVASAVEATQFGSFEALVDGALYEPIVEGGVPKVVLADAVYVDAETGVDANGGGRRAPVGTLARAVALAVM